MNTYRLAPFLLAFSFTSSAVVLTLGPSTQNVTMTGLGANAQGEGTVRLSWGSCNYDGTRSTCVVSGQYTVPSGQSVAGGVGSGGTYAFTLTYPGNGQSPLTATSTAPGGSPTGDNVLFSLSVGSYTFVVTPTGGSPIQFYDFFDNLQYSPATDACTGISSTCAVGNVGLSNGATITGPVSGSFDTTPRITSPNGLISASAYGSFTSIAPATWIEIYGVNLATVPMTGQTWAGTDFQGVNAPTTLGGTSVTVGGKPAYIDYVSPHQVNCQVPSGIGTGSQQVVVTTAGGASTGDATYFVNVNATEPGILAPASFHFGAGQYAVALASNGATYILPPGTTNSVPTALAKPGDTIMLYGIGFGPVTPVINAGVIVGQANSLSGFTATIGGQPATVQFAGLVSGYLGLYQFNLVVPQVPANNATPLTFTLGGASGTQPQLLLAIGN